MRINPDVDAGSHPHISTGRRGTKFGMSIADARAMIRDMARRPRLQVVGLHVHVGSQVTTDRAARARRRRRRRPRARRSSHEGIALEHLDLGGGLGIAYQPGQTVISVERLRRGRAARRSRQPG